MMTVKEIVEETVAYYSADPRRRAMGELGCVYLSEDGRMCAVGRCMRKDVRESYKNCMDGAIEIAERKDGIDHLLSEKYRGHPLGFWHALQKLHDDDVFWDENGIKRRGRERANKIIKLHSGDTQ